MSDLAIAPALREALAGWLAHLAGIEGRAANTIRAYGADVAGFLGFLARHRGGTEGVAALAAGAREVWVETRTDWTPAVAFWAAVGFRPVA